MAEPNERESASAELDEAIMGMIRSEVRLVQAMRNAHQAGFSREEINQRLQDRLGRMAETMKLS
jgi:predicted RNase H-like HicB family nuclease